MHDGDFGTGVIYRRGDSCGRPYGYKNIPLMKFIITALICFTFVSCNSSFIQTHTQSKDSIAPETTVSQISKSTVQAQKYMVTAAHPLATEAGIQILESGGNAADAAIAIQMMLNFAEPQSSGIGGGLFLLYYNKAQNKLYTIDGRETAPARIRDTVFLDEKGVPLDYFKALVGGQSVGTPGVLRALELLHKDHGRLPWKTLFTAAILKAEQGIPFGERLHGLLMAIPTVRGAKSLEDLFFKNGTVIAAGTNHINSDFALTLKQIAEKGVDDFYQGELAGKIVAAVTKNSVTETGLTLTDLKNYQALYRDAVCLNYRAYKVCGMAPPSSGGVTVLQILGILENIDFSSLKWGSVELVHYFVEATKLAYADRAKFIADPDFVSVPVKELLSKSYLQRRAKMIPNQASQEVPAGDVNNTAWFGFDSVDLPSTTHFSVVDAEGNAIAVTSSIEYAFGSTVMVDGFLLNNQLTDFSFVSQVNGTPVANRIESLKRPRSSMAPTMVFNGDGSLRLVLGSPGGARIIQYVAKTLIAVLDYGMDIQTAINTSHFGVMNDAVELEWNREFGTLQSRLEAKKHSVNVVDLNSGLHGIEIKNGKLFGGADPRREGVAFGL